jgi:hypothetical protein
MRGPCGQVENVGPIGKRQPNQAVSPRPCEWPVINVSGGENLLKTRRSPAQAGDTVNGPEQAYLGRCSVLAVPDKRINRVTNKFSPMSQGTLYPVKVFGIISLFERCRDLSTAACPLYDECGDMRAPS